MADVQKENGYVSIANALVDKLCEHRLSGQEWQILWVIIRKTYGWNKKWDHIALSQFHDKTGIDRSKCHHILKGLIRRNIVETRVDHKVNRKLIYYAIQKDFDKWLVLTKRSTGKSVDHKVNKVLPKRSTKLLTKRSTTKDNKDTYTKDSRKFTKPTVEEISKYCQERNNGVDPQRFFDFYESKGWMIGKNKMKDWQAAVRTWEKSTPKPAPKSPMTVEAAKTLFARESTTEKMIEILDRLPNEELTVFLKTVVQKDSYTRGVFQQAKEIMKRRANGTSS